MAASVILVILVILPLCFLAFVLWDRKRLNNGAGSHLSRERMNKGFTPTATLAWPISIAGSYSLHRNTWFLALVFLFAANSWAGTTSGSSVSAEGLKPDAANLSQQDALVSLENLRHVLLPSVFLNQVSGLRAHASKPKGKAEKEFASYNFCDCELDAVLEESPSRTTYFIKPRARQRFVAAYMTVWYYSLDGASVRDSGISNIKVGVTTGSYVLAHAVGAPGGILALSLYGAGTGPRPTVVEIKMRIDDLSDENLTELSALMSAAAHKIELAVR